MFEKLFEFIARHKSFIISTHDLADADGLGAELAFAHIIKTLKKQPHIINASPIPSNFTFIDPEKMIEVWDEEKHSNLAKKSALLIVDTSEEYHIGQIKNILETVQEVFVFDHHEPALQSPLTGFIDSTAASTSELAIEAATEAGITLDIMSAIAAYTGIVYDTGYFAYSKTTSRTFAAALKMVELGVNPYETYLNLSESASSGSLLLQKKVLSTLDVFSNGRIAVQILRKEFLEETGSHFEDADGFINLPMKSKDIAVSIMIKENVEGKVNCSLRSRRTVNVSQIAQAFGGGGHASAAGFRSKLGIEQVISETLKQVLEKVEIQL